MTRLARAAVLAALLALASHDAQAKESALRDAEFGVAARGAVGLERRVEMLQWTRDGEGYALAWSEAPVDSTGFAPGHENAREMPLRTQRWLPGRVTLDGHPVAPGAIEALAEWRPMRPDFSALPGHMSATFQPEGEGLGTAENPVAPRPGDLRITWHERRMPATREPLELRDGTWQVRDPAALAAGEGAGGDDTPRGSWAWTVIGMFAGALFLGVLLLLRRRRGRA